MAKDWGPSEEQKKIFASHGRNIDGSRIQERQTMGGSGGKGGGRPDISPSEVNKSKYNTDKSYGYYNAAGTYVPWHVDIRDGGGMNQSGNYFVGGGLVSGLLNAAKVRPAGAAREMRDGQYVVPIEDIGYRDTKDMYDRGGPQASGGEFQGGGKLSTLANLGYSLSGQEFGERTPYEKVQAQAVITSTNGAIPDATRNAISSLRPMLRPETNPYGVGGGFEQTAPPAMTNPYGVGGGFEQTAPPAPQPPAPMAQAATGLTIPSPAPAPGILEMGGSQDIASMRNELANAGMDTTYMPNDLVKDFYNTYVGINR